MAISDPFNSTNTQTCNYTHDDLARIASANCGSVFSDTYTYDAFGNLTKSGTFQFQPGYNSNNQMTNASYNSVGDVLSDGLHSYAWDSYGRPTTIDSVSVTYDAIGRMVEQGKSGTYTEIQYSPAGFKMQLMNGQSYAKAWVPMPGGTAEVWQASGSSPYYLHSDWLGSSRFASTYSRAMYNDLAYTPFGEPYAQAGSTGVANISFAGNDEDTTTNLYDAQFREYGVQGRWPSPDPAGMAAVDPTNPQSWNRYGYALNNPLIYLDRSGLFCIWDDGSYDSSDDPDTGTISGCEDAGGTWWDGSPADNGLGADWSPDPNANLANQISQEQNEMNNGQIGLYEPVWACNTCTTMASAIASNFDWLMSVPWTATLIIPIPIPGPELPILGVGPAVTFSYNPKSKTACGGLGAGVTAPADAKALSFGPLMHGSLQNADPILQGGNWSAGVQVSPTIGYTAIGGTGGHLGGPSFGAAPGFNATATYSACHSFGGGS